MPQIVKLAMRAVQELGWKLENANEALGLVTFETGISWGSWSGVSCSLNIEGVGENRFRVAGTGKQNVRGGQILAPNLFGEAQGRASRAINKMKELAPEEVLPETAASMTRICRSCGALVDRTQVACDLCAAPLLDHPTRRALNCVEEAANPPIASATPPVTYRVIVEHVGFSRRQALGQIINQEREGLAEADVRAACEQPLVEVACGLSLERANAVMLRLHDEGFSPRKEREVDC
jgi:hypothetical protein